MNIYKFSRHFSETHYVPFLEAYSSALGNNEYYEQVLRVIAMLDDPGIKAKRLSGQMWYEIDDIQDLDIASSMFAPDDDQRLSLIQGRYGGYWRYPRLKDFCYLVNPYFPPKKMVDELKSSFEVLLTQYPSGMRVNSLLAARNFGVHQENILVGNGAAELIKSLMERFDGATGIIRPTFEEYPNRYTGEEVVFTPDNDDFTYTADDLMDFFGDKGIRNLIVVNPDNPTGNYIPKAELLRLMDWAGERNIRLVVDESFADFAVEPDNSLIDQPLLEGHPWLYVMKSISKSYGVPGLRLGVLASGDQEAIAEMKKDVAIWNINSFAEFYLQIEQKYEKDYTAALEWIRAERQRFEAALAGIQGLRVIPSQANYVMVELQTGMSARALTRQLLNQYAILVKDLSSKVRRQDKQYLRLAVRDTRDNDQLIAALRQELR